MLDTQDKKYIEDLMDKKFDDFAMIMKGSFDQVYQKFYEVDKRFDQIDKRFGDVDKRFDRLEYRMDVLEYKVVGGYGRRMDKIEDDLMVVKSKLDLN